MQANFKSINEKISKCLETPNESTKCYKRFTISADKGTAPKDVTRQAVVATCIGEDWLPKETVLGVAPIRKGDALGTAENLKDTLQNY